MGVDIVRGIIKNTTATQALIDSFKELQKVTPLNGTLFLGYPLNAINESVVSVDALLICETKGLVAFIFSEPNLNDEESQDLLYYQLQSTLTKYESLRKKRRLAIDPLVISFYPTKDIPTTNDEYIYCNSETLQKTLNNLPDFDVELYSALCEALQKISSMKPKKKRQGIKNSDSYGGIIKKIEAEIANLDEWQKKSCI